jgi:hypothetical protein
MLELCSSPSLFSHLGNHYLDREIILRRLEFAVNMVPDMALH